MSRTLKDAHWADYNARSGGRPTPRWAAELLIASDAAELRNVAERLWERALRQYFIRDGRGRGLPENHPERMSLSQLAPLVGLHRTNVRRRLEAFAHENPELLPVYVTDQDAAAAPRTGPGAAAVQPGQEAG